MTKKKYKYTSWQTYVNSLYNKKNSLWIFFQLIVWDAFFWTLQNLFELVSDSIFVSCNGKNTFFTYVIVGIRLSFCIVFAGSKLVGQWLVKCSACLFSPYYRYEIVSHTSGRCHGFPSHFFIIYVLSVLFSFIFLFSFFPTFHALKFYISKNKCFHVLHWIWIWNSQSVYQDKSFIWMYHY